MKRKMISVVALLLISSSLMAEKFATTYKNPEAQPVNWKGQKVATFALTLVTSNRNGAEQAMANELTKRGIQGVPGSTLVPPGTEKDREGAKRILAKAGVAGAVLMRIADFKQDMVTTSGTAFYAAPNYASFWGYYDNAVMAYVPGTIDTKTTLVVETLVYSIEQDKLLWAGTSKTTNPKEIDKVIKKLADAVGNEIRKAGLVKK